MRRLIAIISVLMLVAITTPTTNALPPEQTDAGALFGGQSSIANNTTAVSYTHLTLPTKA